MTQNRFYSSTAVSTTLSAPLGIGATTMQVGSVAGFPSQFPYSLTLALDSELQEIVDVTGASGLVLTIARGKDGTPQSAHDAGVEVVHTVSARDYTEPQQHIAASSGVHGLSGTVVGTTDSQTLTNKTLLGAVLDTASSLGGIGVSTLAADRAAWTAYTPTIGGVWTPGNAVIAGSFKLIGKTLTFAAKVVAGTTTAGTGNIVSISLPAGLTLATDRRLIGVYQKSGVSFFAVQGTGTAGGTAFTLLTLDGASGGTANILGAGSYVEICGTVEVT